MRVEDYKIAYGVLCEIVQNKAYAGIALDKALSESVGADKQAITFLVYGVVEHRLSLDKHIDALVSKPPKTRVRVLLQMGVFGVHCMHTPNHSVVNHIVDLCKQIGKEGVSGFVNAVLKNRQANRLTPRGSHGRHNIPSGCKTDW